LWGIKFPLADRSHRHGIGDRPGDVANDWGVLAELERSLITDRTRAGVKAAQRRGGKFGRKPKLTAQQIGHARKLIADG
jgi:hypothetical protein